MDKLLKTVQEIAKRAAYTREHDYYLVGPIKPLAQEYLAINMLGSLGKKGYGKPQLIFQVRGDKLVCTPTYLRRDGYPMYHGAQELRGKPLRKEIRKMCKHADFPPHVADRVINFLNTLYH